MECQDCLLVVCHPVLVRLEIEVSQYWVGILISKQHADIGMGNSFKQLQVLYEMRIDVCISEYAVEG